jgi:hypothetical protein
MTDRTYDTASEDRMVGTFFNYVYSYMFKGVGLTALIIFALGAFVPANIVSVISIVGLIAMIVSIFFIIPKVMTGSPEKALKWFYIFAIINGMALGAIGFIYPIKLIFMAFVGASVTFGTAGAYGRFTGKDISGWGKYLLIALISLIVVMIIDIVLAVFFGMNFTMLDIIISIAGIIIFTGLTAWDHQTLKNQFIDMGGFDNPDTKNLAVMGALSLYLDFINLFLFFLRLLGVSSSND